MNWINSLREDIGEDKVIDEIETRKIYSRDESDIEGFLCDCVVFPQNEDDVLRVVRFAKKFNIPLTPRGGGTGVSGGAIPLKGGILLSFSKMNRILNIDEKNMILEVEPGVILKDIYERVEKLGLFYPPDPASYENCTVGGNVATNAGGPRCVKYGVTANYVLGLEVVVPEGEKIFVGKKTRKWKAGYNLPGIFIGSEGTLGLFTKIYLRLLPLPEYVQTLLVPFEKKENAGRCAAEIISKKIIPRCIEYVDESVIEIIGDEIKKFLPPKTKAFLLLEFDGEEGEVKKNIEKALPIVEGNNPIEIYTGIEKYERDKIWRIRKDILPYLERTGYKVRSEDVCVPFTQTDKLIKIAEEIKEKLPLKVCVFGHIGDGNLHVNFLWKKGEEGILNKGVEFLYREVLKLGGTITGEHGIGILKKGFLKMEQKEYLINLQKKIKEIFDPQGILNPGKLF